MNQLLSWCCGILPEVWKHYTCDFVPGILCQSCCVEIFLSIRCPALDSEAASFCQRWDRGNRWRNKEGEEDPSEVLQSQLLPGAHDHFQCWEKEISDS